MFLPVFQASGGPELRLMGRIGIGRYRNPSNLFVIGV